MITDLRVGDSIAKSEFNTGQKYNDVVGVFEQWGFKFDKLNKLNPILEGTYSKLNGNYLLLLTHSFMIVDYVKRGRELTYKDIMSLKKVDVDNCNIDKLVSVNGSLQSNRTIKQKSNRVSTVNRDLEGQMKGNKFDGDKLRFSLIPPQPLSDVNKVLEFGAKKYGANNWQKVDNAQERYFNAAMRHLLSWQSGNLVDEESELPHLAHAQCCLMFMMHFDVEAKEVK